MGYLAGGPVAQVNRTVTPGQATGNGQTIIPIPGGFQPKMTDVFVGGAMLTEGDYDDSSGIYIELAKGMAQGTSYRVVSYNAFAQVQPVAGQLAGFRNLLMNAAGRVNQRGFPAAGTTTSANQYTLDRWRVVVSGQSFAYLLTSNAYTMTAPAGGLEQVIEGANIFGGTYCLNWVGTATATVNGVAVAKRGTFTLPANTNVTVRFSNGSVYQPQLEYGSEATQFESIPLRVDEANCQRYYETGTTTMVCSNGAVTAFNGAVVPVHFAASKRVTPAMGVSVTSNSGMAGVGVSVTTPTDAIFSPSVQAAAAAYAIFTWSANAEL